jgi:hypothetical protein
MKQDPIITEIHRIREELWRECHGNPEEMAERQRRLQEGLPAKLIDPVKWKRQRERDRNKAR